MREGWNRAAKLDGKRRNTVVFSLTVLQRRLASSPEAIYNSLVRRSERLERRKGEVLDGVVGDQVLLLHDADILEDPDEYAAEDVEELEEELVDAATAARTVVELEAELLDLARLTKVAQQVRDRGPDRKGTR